MTPKTSHPFWSVRTKSKHPWHLNSKNSPNNDSFGRSYSSNSTTIPLVLIAMVMRTPTRPVWAPGPGGPYHGGWGGGTGKPGTGLIYIYIYIYTCDTFPCRRSWPRLDAGRLRLGQPRDLRLGDVGSPSSWVPTNLGKVPTNVRTCLTRQDKNSRNITILDLLGLKLLILLIHFAVIGFQMFALLTFLGGSLDEPMWRCKSMDGFVVLDLGWIRFNLCFEHLSSIINIMEHILVSHIYIIYSNIYIYIMTYLFQ